MSHRPVGSWPISHCPIKAEIFTREHAISCCMTHGVCRMTRSTSAKCGSCDTLFLNCRNLSPAHDGSSTSCRHGQPTKPRLSCRMTHEIMSKACRMTHETASRPCRMTHKIVPYDPRNRVV